MSSDIDEVIGRRDAWDPLMSESRPEWYWTTTNIGEALPGVMTPLMWTLWGPSIEHAPRQSAFLIGGLTREESAVPPRVQDWYCQVFYGRAAIRMDMMATIGDRLPGTSGREAVANIFGEVPSDMEFHPTRRRYGMVAWRLPALFLAFPKRLAALSQDFDAWWKRSISSLGHLDHGQVRALLADAVKRHDEAMVMQTNGIFSTMQPLYDAVAQLVKAAGAGDLSVLTGASGGAEMAVVSDIWRASRGEITIERVVGEHGFHGPHEGELSSRVWREDDTPLRRIVDQYAGRDDAQDPRLRDATRGPVYTREAQAVLAGTSGPRRPVASLVLRLARERLPLRGVGKRAFLQANDVARAAARRLGEDLANDGTLEEPEDVFYLTVSELSAPALPSDARELVRLRRERRDVYQRLRLPDTWQGAPVPVPELAAPESGADDGLAVGAIVTGLGVSGGIVEGVVRVVTDPSFAEVEPDEVLVAPVTDPSWSSIMFISAALVVDIGGALSHAAVVARELDIPCVVGTQDASRRLRTGDRVRVDGHAGTIELLE